jgi:hypothetical protein
LPIVDFRLLIEKAVWRIAPVAISNLQSAIVAKRERES